MAKSYTIFEDPGHSWLRVPLADLGSSRLLISPYSYRNGKYAYLEEDRDAYIFLQHKFGKCVTMKDLRDKGILKERHTNNSSHIRKYPHYYLTE